MHLSLTLEGFPGRDCSRCGARDTITLAFTVITEDASGDAAELCLKCAVKGGTVDVPLTPLTGKASKKKTFKKIKKVSLKQEVEVCEALGARTQPGSGNQAGAKGDGRRIGELRIEAKFTAADSYSLKREELLKLLGEATQGELPIFVIDYKEPGSNKLRDRYAVVPFDELVELVELRRERNAARKHRGSKRG